MMVVTICLVGGMLFVLYFGWKHKEALLRWGIEHLLQQGCHHRLGEWFHGKFFDS